MFCTSRTFIWSKLFTVLDHKNLSVQSESLKVNWFFLSVVWDHVAVSISFVIVTELLSDETAAAKNVARAVLFSGFPTRDPTRL